MKNKLSMIMGAVAPIIPFALGAGLIVYTASSFSKIRAFFTELLTQEKKISNMQEDFFSLPSIDISKAVEDLYNDLKGFNFSPPMKSIQIIHTLDLSNFRSFYNLFNSSYGSLSEYLKGEFLLMSNRAAYLKLKKLFASVGEDFSYYLQESPIS